VVVEVGVVEEEVVVEVEVEVGKVEHMQVVEEEVVATLREYQPI